MGTWTLLMMQLLVLSQTLEIAVETNVHSLSAELVCERALFSITSIKWKNVLPNNVLN